MTLSRLSEKKWDQVRIRYQMGDKIRDIAKDCNIDSGNLVTKMKREGLVHGSMSEFATEAAESINNVAQELVQCSDIAANNKYQQQLIAKEVLRRFALLKMIDETHEQVIKLSSEVAKQARKVVKNNPSGFYVKGHNDHGPTYGRNSELLKDLTPIIATIGQRLNPAHTSHSTSVAVQSNQQVNNDNSEKVIINVQGVE